ncbi:MAG TPA: hypothetical protein VG897_04180 [Terriglobales bacterium]|nr:hypothetical protein [Terriglobales bacterium]
MSRVGRQIGVAGQARWKGIPDDAKITWTGSVSGNPRVGEVFSSLEVDTSAGVADGKDNRGAIVQKTITNDAIRVVATIIPVGAANTDALAIASDPPLQGSLVKVESGGGSPGATNDPQMNLDPTNEYWIVDSSAKRTYTPDGDPAISMTLLALLDDDGTIRPFESLTVS